MYPQEPRGANSRMPPGGQPLMIPEGTHSFPPSTDDITASSPLTRPYRAGSSSHSSINEQDSDLTRASPYGYGGSSQSLPRYSSGHSSLNYLPTAGYSSNTSPLNPAVTRGGQSNGGRLDSYGYAGAGRQGAHPLSNAMYMDSSPTLAGSEAANSSDEKIRKPVSDIGTDYQTPSTTTQVTPASYRRQPKPTGLTALYRFLGGQNIADSGRDERHVKLPRLGYLDGCKFIAAWLVLNATLFDSVLTSGHHYGIISRNSPLYITRSFSMGCNFLLLLMGRSLITPLWDVPPPTSKTQANTALISWARLTRAMLVRPFRFILPVIAVAALQWGLGASGRTSNCNAVGLEEPYWSQIKNFAGFSTLVFNLFTYFEYDTLAGRVFSANLFTAPWFFMGSYAAYTSHLMLGNLSSNRYWIYAILSAFSWTTYNYFLPVFIGVAFADMHAHGHLHRIRTKWNFAQRITLHIALIVIACVTQFVPIIRDNINSGMATINVQDHPELQFCDVIFVACWLFCIETSGLAQSILGNVIMRWLGKLSAGMYLLAPALTFTIVPDIALSMSGNGSSASSILGVTWLVMFIVAFALAIVFHLAVELPSKMLGEIVAEVLEGSDGSRHKVRQHADGAKLTKKHAPAPAAATGPAKLTNQRSNLPPAKPVLV